MNYTTLQSLISVLETESDKIQPDRQNQLDIVAKAIAKELSAHDIVKVMAICTHNSRRSQLMEAWLLAMALHYDMEGLSMYSGGTEATAFNVRMVVAMRQVGFQLIEDEIGTNPKYILLPGREPILQHIMYSKKYDDTFNPTGGFIALMVCSEADKNCPLIPSAKDRFSLPYRDPKEDDDTPFEQETYFETIQVIGREVIYLMKKVKRLSN